MPNLNANPTEPGGPASARRFSGGTTLDDGRNGASSVDAFAPNGCGMFNVSGNVWDWTADWIDPAFRARQRGTDPVGPTTGTRRLRNTGSHLYRTLCRRHRVAARQRSQPDASTGDLGFRCAADFSRVST